MAYDDVVIQMGEFGPYQRRMLAILCLPTFFFGIHKLSGVFLSAEADFRCVLPEESPENVTYQSQPTDANVSFPWNHNTETWSRCETYDRGLVDHNLDLGRNLSFTSPTVKCHTFVYDKSQYTSTVATEWNLVCDKAWLRATSNAVFTVGELLGTIISGGIADRYGRKVIFLHLLIIQFLSGMLVAASPDLISYMIFRLVLGWSSNGLFLVAYVMIVEMVSPKKRLLAGTISIVTIAMGSISIAGLACLIRSWRILQITFAAPTLLFIAYWWLISESARWLLSRGRVKEATDILKKAAYENGVQLSEDVLDGLSNDGTIQTSKNLQQPSVLDLLRTPNLRRRSLLLSFVWFMSGLTFYSLSWNSVHLEGNDYVNFTIAIAVEIPAYFVVLFTLDKWGRKIIVCGSMLITGASLLPTLFGPAGMPWVVLVATNLGKCAITTSYSALYVFTAEQYPTVIRNIGLGTCSTFSRAGGILAPYISHLAGLWTHLPLVLLGSCSLLAGLLSLLLPETLNTRLPESIQDTEEFGKRIVITEKYTKHSNDLVRVPSPTAQEIQLRVYH